MEMLHSGDIVTFTSDTYDVIMFGIVLGYARAVYRYNEDEDTIKGMQDFELFNRCVLEQARKPVHYPVKLDDFNVMILRIGCYLASDSDLAVTKSYIKAVFKSKLGMHFMTRDIVLKRAYQLSQTGYKQENFNEYAVKNAMLSKNIATLNSNVITGEEILDLIQSNHSNRSKELAYVKQFNPAIHFELGKVYLMKSKQYNQLLYSLLLCVKDNLGYIKFLTLEKDITHSTFEQDILKVATELSKPSVYDCHAYAEKCKNNARGKFCSYDAKKDYYATSLEMKDIDGCIKYWKI